MKSILDMLIDGALWIAALVCIVMFCVPLLCTKSGRDALCDKEDV